MLSTAEEKLTLKSQSSLSLVANEHELERFLECRHDVGESHYGVSTTNKLMNRPT